MGTVSQDIIRIDVDDMKRLHRALRTLDAKEGRALTSRLRKIVKPLERNVRVAVMKQPSKMKYTKDDKQYAKTYSRHRLRAGIAGSVETRISSSKNGASARIRVSRTKFAALTGKPGSLPRYYEGLTKKPWRHPVFADKGADRGTWEGAWADQDPAPYLLPTVLPNKNAIRERLIAEYSETFAKHLRIFNIPVR